MERTVEANLTKAKRGGIPGVLSLIEAYLNVVHTSRYSFEDCLYPNTNHPIWTVLFYCLRVGDLPAAAEVATKILSATHCSTLVNILLNLPKKSSIDNETRVKLRTEWRQSLNTCKDNYKKAVYAAFLGYDCHEINTNIEDWLWARLFNCKMNQFERTKSFRQLQLTVCVECGEKYFVLDGGSKLLYYSVLLLTGQLEQAINALLHESCLVHAVHLAILFHQLRLLIVNEDVSADTLTTDVHDPTICKLNLAKIVLLYIKNFELTDVNYALNYCFFLNKLNLDSVVGTTGGRNLFESCVSRLVHLTGETDKILGKLNENGERLPGIIDKFSSSVNIYKVIACVASDINLYGKPLQTINLYALANHPNEAIKLMSNQLAATITDPKSNSAKETITLAKWLERRYRSAAGEHLSTLHCLIQLYDVFLLYSNHQYAEVLDAMQSIKLIPMECEEVQAHVNTFHMVPEEVRPVLPELCTLLMDSIASLYSLQSSDSLITSILKDSAKALALYTATIPYKFPLSVNSILLQLQTKIL